MCAYDRLGVAWQGRYELPLLFAVPLLAAEVTPGVLPRIRHTADLVSLPATDLADLIQQLTQQMHAAAAELHFELAARLRDEVSELKKELRGMRAAGAG